MLQVLPSLFTPRNAFINHSHSHFRQSFQLKDLYEHTHTHTQMLVVLSFKDIAQSSALNPQTAFKSFEDQTKCPLLPQCPHFASEKQSGPHYITCTRTHAHTHTKQQAGDL